MASIYVYPIDENYNPQEIVDKRKWKENQTDTIKIESKNANFKQKSKYNVSISLRNAKNVQTSIYDKLVDCLNSNFLEISVTSEQEKKMHSMNNKNPFNIEIFANDSKEPFMTGKFYRRKSEKKLNDDANTEFHSLPCTYSQTDFLKEEKTRTFNPELDHKTPIGRSQSLSVETEIAENQNCIRVFPTQSNEAKAEYEIVDTRAWSDTNEFKILIEVCKFNLKVNKHYKICINKGEKDILETSVLSKSSSQLELILQNKELENNLQTKTPKDPFELNIYEINSKNPCLSAKFFRLKPDKSNSQPKIVKIPTPTLKKIKAENNSVKIKNTFNFDDFIEKSKYLKEKFYSYTILITSDYVNSPDKQVITENMTYLVPSEKTFVSNHAIRLMNYFYDIKYFCSFKLEIKQTGKVRNGAGGLSDESVEDELEKLFKYGIDIKINNSLVNFFYIGHSNSGMKEHNFWAIDKESMEKINFDDFLKKLGNFDETSFKSIGKLTKRYALAFSSSQPTLLIPKNQTVCVPDDTTLDKKYEYTDGIGLIRLKIAEKVSKILELENFTAKIFQIRCDGYKGVLVTMPDEIFNKILEKNKIKDKNINVIFRKSQCKFTTNNQDFILNIVSWVPEQLPPGSLNIESIMILDGLDENSKFREILFERYQKTLDEIGESLDNPKKALMRLFSGAEITNFTVKYASILLACNQDMTKSLEKSQHDIIKRLILEQSLYQIITKRKLNITIEKSRYLMGIVDETETLDENEVFVSYRDSKGDVNYLSGGLVLVGRNPCYALSEMRLVKTRYVPELRNLVNCIAFPKKGNRPLPNLLSGGDLDGDIYLVSWDEIFLGIQNSDDLIEYPDIKEPENFKSSKNLIDQIRKYFSKICLVDEKIGLHHYKLVCLYDKNREEMKKREYKESVVEITKSIDGSIFNLDKSTQKQKRDWQTKPNWYITGSNLKAIEQEALFEGEKDKLLELGDLIRNKKDLGSELNYKDTSKSLLSRMIHLTISKYSELIKKLNESSDGKFLNDEEISILENNQMIDLTLCSENIFMYIEDAYCEYIGKIKNKINSSKVKEEKTPSLFTGMAEKVEKSKFISQNEKEKINALYEFRKFVVDFEYSKYKQKDYPKSILKMVHSPSGIFFQSRVVSIYLKYRDATDYRKNIPWEFYDTLCLLKNYANSKTSEKISQLLPDNVPFTMPFDYIKSFSLQKMINVADCM